MERGGVAPARVTHLTHMPMFVGFPLILTTHNTTPRNTPRIAHARRKLARLIERQVGCPYCPCKRMFDSPLAMC